MVAQNAVILGVMTALFLGLGYLGVPVAFALIAGVMVGTALTPITFQSMVGQLFNGIGSESLMAIPFFLLVGELMTSANVVIRIANLSQALVGHIRGGLAQVTTVFSMFFSGMSGSSSADVAVLTRTMAVPMAREGYRPEFVAALIAAASTIAALVPPSIMAVVYGAIGNVSIAGLFLGGIVPGLMIGLGLMVYCYFFGPAGLRRPRATMGQLGSATRMAVLPMMIPVILLGGILTGWFTPTEAGVVAVTYILLVVLPLLKPEHWRQLPGDFVQAGLVFSLPLITIAAASAFGWLVAYLRGPIVVSAWIGSVAGTDPMAIMFLLVLVFVIVGDFIEPIPAIIIFMPVVNQFERVGGDQQRAYGGGADSDARVRADHAALWAGAADGVEVREHAVFDSVARVVADLRDLLRDDRIHHFCAGRDFVSAKDAVSRVGGVLQGAGGRGIHLPLSASSSRRPGRRGFGLDVDDVRQSA